MRRITLPLVASLFVLTTSCTDTSTRPTAFAAPMGARYQLTQSGTLDAEITALIQALFAPELEPIVLSKWAEIKTLLAGGPGEIARARLRLVDLTDFVNSNQSHMDPPPNNESIPTATARLVLYMSLYVYDGPTTPVPPQLGVGSDAKTEIVTPTTPATIQTPQQHAAVGLDAGSVTTNTIIVVTQNTDPFPSHCSGPFTSKYCQYPTYYTYHSFPHVRFEKAVHVAMCPVPPGGNYGPLPGISDDKMVAAHTKPADPADYTPGGYPVPGEAIEILPVNPGFDPTHPKVICAGTTYGQVKLFHVPQRPHGALANALAFAARAGNGAASFVGRMLTPKSAYAIDNGEEHNTFMFSDFANMDTTGRPDLRVSQTTLSQGIVTAGSALTVNYALSNIGTAPGPGVATTIRLTPIRGTQGSFIDLVAGPAVSASTIFPLDARTEAATVTIPLSAAPGSYTIGPIVSTTGGLRENPLRIGNNRQLIELTVLPVPTP